MPAITSLVSADEMSKNLGGLVSAERLTELAESGIAPHYIVDSSVFFGVAETKEWCAHNLMQRFPGMQLKNMATVITVVKQQSLTIPDELKGIAGYLLPFSLNSKEGMSIAGIYFLLENNTVVYVGQSVNLVQRVASHYGNKTFESALLLRLPERDLNYMESFFIQHLNPRYNKARGAGSPDGFEPLPESDRVLSAIGGSE